MQRVSIIVPVYNHESSITKCIQSVVQQDFSGEIEIIIVNDGSTDNSLAKILELKNLYPNQQIIVLNQANGGVSVARNAGLRIARFDYVALLDADDSWHENKLTVQLKLMLENNIDFSGSILSDRPLKRYLFREVGNFIEINLINLLFKFCFQPSTVLFRREILREVGFFDENMRYAEEGNFFMRIVNHGYRCVLINQKLTEFGAGSKKSFGESGLSGDLNKMQNGEVRNHKYAYKHLNVPFYIYFTARIVSELKYLRRILIVAFR